MKLKNLLPKFLAGFALLAGAAPGQTLDFVARTQITENNQRAKISVFPGKAGWESTNVIPANSGVFGDGTVTDYRFINSNGNDLISYADGGAGLIPTPTSPLGAGFVSGTQNWSDVWKLTDPGDPLFSTTPDISPAGWSGGADVFGTIDISTLSGAGSLYFMHGTFINNWSVTVTLIDNDAVFPDIVASDSEGNGPGTNLGWISEFSFCSASDYETISYYYFNGDRDGSRARFMGVILDQDDTAPAIASMTPPDDSTTFFKGGNIEFTFDEDFTVGTGNITIKNLDLATDTVIDITDGTQVTIVDRTVTIDPTADLEFSTNYAIQIDAGIFGDCASPPNTYAGIADDTTWNFTTLAPDSTPPVLSSTVPVNSTTVVPAADLVATFDEGIQALTGNITLRNLTDAIDTVIDITDTSQVTFSGSDLIINPTNPLTGGKNYAVQIDNAALENLAGFAFAGINDDTTWFFSTYLETTLTANGNWVGGAWTDPPGEPSPGLNANIDPGVVAVANNSVNPWSGVLTLGAGSSLQIDAGTNPNPANMAFDGATQFVLNDGSYIRDNFKTTTFAQDWLINGTAGLDSTNNAGNNHNRIFDGVISGDTWVTDGRNLQGYTYNVANTFTAYEVRSTEGQRHGVAFNAAGAAGLGNVTVTSGTGAASAVLILGADDVFATSAILTLDGKGWDGSSGGFGPYAGGAHVGNSARISMNSFNATVSELYIDGTQIPMGSYSGADGFDWIVGTGILTVTNGVNAAPTLVSIEDNVSGGPITEDQAFTYLVTFDEPIDASTVSADDFESAGSPAPTITSVSATSDPAVFAVCVTPGGAGTIQLQIKATTEILDIFGGALDTSSAIADDTTITVDAGSQPAREVVTVNGVDGNPGTAPVTAENNSGALTFTFDASGSDKLVVISATEDGNGSPNATTSSVTYDGEALTQAVFRPGAVGNITYGSIWYLDNPTTSTGEIVVTSNNRNSVTAIGLSGTAPGVGATAVSPDNSKSVGLATTAENSIVIASHGMGGNGNTADVTNVDAVAPLVEIGAIEFGSNWGGHVSASASVASPCFAFYEFTGGSALGTHTIAAEFQGAVISTPAPLVLTITADGANLDMSWNSLPGMQYDLLSSDDPETEPDPSLWAIYNDGVTVYEDIPATGTMTMLDDVLKVGTTRFFALREEAIPPLLMEDFEAGNGGFTFATTAGSDWAHGAPNSSSPGGTVTAGNGGSTNCWGTDIGNPGQYIDPTTTLLRSTVIDLTGVSGASLSFAEALDLEAGDTAVVNIIDDTTDTVISAAIYTADDTAGDSDANWNSVGPIAIPAAALGQAVRIEWSFNGLGGGTNDYMGWYIDDVLVVETP